MPAPRRFSASSLLTGAFVILLLATVIIGAIQLALRPRTQLTRVIVGTKDEVYYYHAASSSDARLLGEALRNVGFFKDRGTTVLLSKGTDGTLVSFVLNEGGWDHPDTVYSFEEIGRRIANSVGGFPIHVRLIDSRRVLHKDLTVGKLLVGSKDSIYYLGSATEGEARSLGDALRGAGFLRDLGVTVVLSKGFATELGFVVNDGVWDASQAVSGFQQLTRAVAPAIGGLPVRLRLLNGDMIPQRMLPISETASPSAPVPHP